MRWGMGTWGPGTAWSLLPNAAPSPAPAWSGHGKPVCDETVTQKEPQDQPEDLG